MKRFVSVVLVLFVLLTGLFAQNNGQWKHTYSKILTMTSFHDEFSTFDFNDELYAFTVSLWYKCFPEVAVKYGIPFVCAYDWNRTSEMQTGSTWLVRDGMDVDYCVISINDNHIDRCNAATDVKTYLHNKQYDNSFMVKLIVHELCHVSCFLQQKGDESMEHSGSMWIKESNRILLEYGIDVVTGHYY